MILAIGALLCLALVSPAKLIASVGAAESPEVAPTINKSQPPVLVPPDSDLIFNQVRGRVFAENYSKRCKRSTKLDLTYEQEPNFVLFRAGGAQQDVHLTLDFTETELLASGFEPNKSTVFFIHGWLPRGSVRNPFVQQTRGLLQRLGNEQKANYIVFDWQSLASGPYSDIAARVGGIANYLVVFIEKLYQITKLDPMSVHLIAHSIGAHIAGFAGRRIKPQIGRITALDPTSTCFPAKTESSKVRRNDRLMVGDAYQVDVYHYDDLVGYKEAIGDFDVFVNGGKSQTGSTRLSPELWIEMITSTLFNRDRELKLGHLRASLVATEQLAEGKCQQVAYECSDYASFLKGQCSDCGQNNESCFVMGFPFQYKSHPKPAQGLRNRLAGHRAREYHIVIEDNSRFCTNHYQIVVTFEQTEEMIKAAASNKWRLYLELSYETSQGIKNSVGMRITNRSGPSIFSHLLTTDMEPVKFTGGRLRASKRFNRQVPLKGREEPKIEEFLNSAFKVNDIEVKYMSNIDPSVRAKYSSRLCAGETRGLIDELRFERCQQSESSAEANVQTH